MGIFYVLLLLFSEVLVVLCLLYSFCEVLFDRVILSESLQL